MIFEPSPIQGAYIVQLGEITDQRGMFARTFCVQEFTAQGIDARAVQSQISYSKLAGTLRGLHWQVPPRAQGKALRCIRGALWDVIVDIRPDSPTFGQHFGVEISASNRLILLPRMM